jgi:hypothetical protein
MTNTDDGHFEAKSMAVVGESLVETDIVPTVPDMTKLYTEQFLSN